jgi:hypothetical protein
MICWSIRIWVEENGDFEEIKTIGALLKLFDKYNLNIPKQLINDYQKREYGKLDLFGADSGGCLCPIQKGTLGNDALTERIIDRSVCGDFKFTKLNEEIIEYQFEDKEKEQMKINDLNPNLIFHKIILRHVIKENKELIIGGY